MLKSILNSLKQDSFLKNILLVLSGTFLAQLLGFFTSPIITRLYLPYEFGIFSIFMAVVGVLASFSSLRYEVAIPIERNDRKAFALIKLSLLIPVVICVLIIIIYLIFGNQLLSSITQLHKISDVLWLIPVLFFFTALFRVFSSWSLRDKDFKLISKVKVIQSISSSLLKIVMGIMGFGVVGLLSGNFCQETVGITAHVNKLKKSGFSFFSNNSWQEIKDIAFRYRKFPIYQTWSQLLLSIGQKLPIFYITYLFGLEIVGLYGFASSIISIPIRVIGTSVSQVYFAEISSIGKNNNTKLLSLSNYVIKRLFVISIFPFLVVLFFGPNLFSFVFGENWEMSGEIAQYIIFLIMVRFVSNPIMSYLNVIEKQQLQVKMSVIRVMLIVVIFSISELFDLNIKETMLVYSIPIGIFYLTVMFYVLNLMKNNNNNSNYIKN